MNENNSHCKYFVLRKKRYCRMTVKRGLDYCGEHLPKAQDTTETSDNSSELRVPCPLDSKHTCFASKLAKHLTKCNAKKVTGLPYIVSGINVDGNYKDDNTSRQLGAVPAKRILEVVERVNKLYEELIQNTVTKEILHSDLLSEELSNPEYGATTRKHLLQTSSLIEHLKQANLIQPNTCFVELGAGKGQLSFWISKSVNAIPGTSVLLVDRASMRHKLDNKLDKVESRVHRIRADIADLALSKVDVVMRSEKVVGITKHLCGEANDLALRCLQNGLNQGTNISGLVMASCCHHRCHWPNYIGKDFFADNHLTREDFDIICGLVSWATCGTGKSREARKNQENKDEEKSDVNENVDVRTRDAELNLSREERELVGRKCKLLLDFGRLSYLEKNKFKCRLHFYVEQSVTLENVCLVAVKS